MLKVTFAEGFGAPIDVRAELHPRLGEIASTIGPIPAHHWESGFSTEEGHNEVRNCVCDLGLVRRGDSTAARQ
ncbi:MAG: hypothetical protein AUH41_07350 [Gemmatimonadetes bacterium 13_1_40CM_66_11]|nr:MAG: hypothetical protein AUH41_07350 [Gemmatimonadetes bacterium 13_1_40CM_66_11]OLD33989.1 MAG: hypothetical protein AUI19_03685 [Myxococcales bacterium 13_1_40CM_2_68_15]